MLISPPSVSLIKLNLPRQTQHAVVRFLSASSLSIPTSSSRPNPAALCKPLSFVNRTSAILPRILSQKNAETSKSLRFWNSIVSQVHEDLQNTTNRPARIVFCGVGPWSGAEELVTSLLDEPLNTEASQEAIRNRWGKVSQNQLTIFYGTTKPGGSPTADFQPSYLSQFPVEVEITERRPTSSAILDETTLSMLYGADIPVVICNPLCVTLSTFLHDNHIPANSILVLTSGTSRNSRDAINILLNKYGIPSKDLKVLFVDPTRALQAVRILSANSQDASAIRQYQNNFLESGIITVTEALKGGMSTGQSSKPDTQVSVIRSKAAYNRLQDILALFDTSLKRRKDDLNNANVDISNFTSHVEESRAKIERTILGISQSSLPISNKTSVEVALWQAENEMRSVIDRLTLRRMLQRIDEISAIVTSAVERTWCPGLERELILHTGSLSDLQKRLTSASFFLLSSHSTLLDSALLQNKLNQLKSSPNYTLTPYSLIAPLSTRRNQINHPTTQLHVSAQRTIFEMLGGISVGTGMSWCGWLGWLSGTGEGLLGFIGMDAGTAVGAGLLCVVASVRWAMGRWEKAKKLWWQDWHRISEGLDRNLKDTIKKVINEKVVVVAEATCAEMKQVCLRQEEEMVELQDTVTQLKSDLNDFMQQKSQPIDKNP